MFAPSTSSSADEPATASLIRRTGFSVEPHEQGGSLVLHLQGELDTSTARQLRHALTSAMAGDATAIVLDLAELSFIDSTGIAVFLSALRRADDEGRTFGLRHPGRMVRKVLRLTGVDRLLVDEETELAVPG